MSTTKPTIELTNATILSDGNGLPHRAMGKRADGNVLTSNIVRVDVEAQTIETRNTIYKVVSWHQPKS